MNASLSTFVSSMELEPESIQHPYYDWVSANFPLLTSVNLELEYARAFMKLFESFAPEQIAHSGIVITVDCQNPIYQDLLAQALQQFAQLCVCAEDNDRFGAEAREFLGYLVLSDGYPAYSEQRHLLAERGALVLRQLMMIERFRPDIHAAVSGIIAYSPCARVQIRLIMLDAFAEYFSAKTRVRPEQSELCTILFDGLNLELRRSKSEQNFEFQARLIKLLIEHPHPATEVVLSVIADEHGDNSLGKLAAESLRQLHNSLCRVWELTRPDQVSNEDLRAQNLAQIMDYSFSEEEQIQSIFNACKGLKIVHLSDPRLSQLNALLLAESNTIRLASAIALSKIYSLDPACEVASKAIGVLTDWAVNGEEGDHMLDALSAVKSFEAISPACAKKVEIGYIKANQKFIFRNRARPVD